MRRVTTLVCRSLVLLAMVDVLAVDAFGQNAPDSVGRSAGSRRRLPDVPQAFVVCNGWHALCSASHDCKMDGDIAECACFRVNEAHIVATGEIQDDKVKRLTEAQCTEKHPCGLDEAPICRAIASGAYKVDGIRYLWVSTYSYRGWCGLLRLKLKACDPTVDGYSGDRYWAICDAAPCTESRHPSDPEKPLICQCRGDTEPFVGMNDSCTGESGGIMSSMPLWAWDFENNTYPFTMPGYEFVKAACDPLTSDPLEEGGRRGGSR